MDLIKGFIKSYSEENKEGYFLEVDIQYPEEWHELHDNFPFFPERTKIENLEKLVACLLDRVIMNL